MAFIDKFNPWKREYQELYSSYISNMQAKEKRIQELEDQLRQMENVAAMWKNNANMWKAKWAAADLTLPEPVPEDSTEPAAPEYDFWNGGWADVKGTFLSWWGKLKS